MGVTRKRLFPIFFFVTAFPDSARLHNPGEEHLGMVLIRCPDPVSIYPPLSAYPPFWRVGDIYVH